MLNKNCDGMTVAFLIELGGISHLSLSKGAQNHPDTCRKYLFPV